MVFANLVLESGYNLYLGYSATVLSLALMMYLLRTLLSTMYALSDKLDLFLPITALS